MNKNLKSLILSTISQYKVSFILMSFIGLISAFDFSIRPYLLKIITNRIINNAHIESYLDLVLWPIVGYIAILVVVCITCKIEGLIILKVFPKKSMHNKKRVMHTLTQKLFLYFINGSFKQIVMVY